MCGKIPEHHPYDPHAGEEEFRSVKESPGCLVREQGERSVCPCGGSRQTKNDMLIVKKFGGSSVANKERIFRVAERCIEEYKKGNDVVVVLSAMGDTTDELLAKAADINPNAPKRDLDMLLTTGRAGVRIADGDGNACAWSAGSIAECVSGHDALYIQVWKCKI